MMLNFRLNKKGDISVGVMVVLTIVLFVYILGAMSLDLAKISGNFDDVSNLNDVYSRQQAYETTLYFRLVEVSLNSYKGVIEENYMKIGDPSLDLNALFRANVETNFKKFDEKMPEELKTFFGKVDSFEFDGSNINVSISNWKVEENLSSNKEDGSKVFYSSSLNSSFNFNRVGLPSLNEINQAQFICSEISVSEYDFKDCLNESLPQFSFSVNPASPGRLNVISRDMYYLNKKMDSISFGLFFDSDVKALS